MKKVKPKHLQFSRNFLPNGNLPNIWAMEIIPELAGRLLSLLPHEHSINLIFWSSEKDMYVGSEAVQFFRDNSIVTEHFLFLPMKRCRKAKVVSLYHNVQFVSASQTAFLLDCWTIFFLDTLCLGSKPIEFVLRGFLKSLHEDFFIVRLHRVLL